MCMKELKDWLVTFWKVLTRPLPDTFIQEAEKADGKLLSVWGWLVFVYLSVLLGVYFTYGRLPPVPAMLLLFMLFPLVFLVFVFGIHLVSQKVFHRKKNHYNQLLYLMTAIFVPFTIVDLFVGYLPNVGVYLHGVIVFYMVALMVVAVKTIVKLRAWESIVTILLALLLAAGGMVCIPIFVLSLIGVLPRLL